MIEVLKILRKDYQNEDSLFFMVKFSDHIWNSHSTRYKGNGKDLEIFYLFNGCILIKIGRILHFLINQNCIS